VAEAVDRLATVRKRFGQDYETMLDRVLERGLPTAVCTIYDTRIPQPRWGLVVTALSVFNDCITQGAFARNLPVIDLRLICDQDEDYANPIEPSVRGGEKIAMAIAGLGTDAEISDPFGSPIFKEFSPVHASELHHLFLRLSL
jgi:hypothetical protein